MNVPVRMTGFWRNRGFPIFLSLFLFSGKFPLPSLCHNSWLATLFLADPSDLRDRAQYFLDSTLRPCRADRDFFRFLPVISVRMDLPLFLRAKCQFRQFMSVNAGVDNLCQSVAEMDNLCPLVVRIDNLCQLNVWFDWVDNLCRFDA